MTGNCLSHAQGP